jgi:type I restriction enzyme S subunit
VKEQQAIACILGALDDKIELNRRMNKTLEETARAIFKSWFVDFDPVRAKAACHAPLGLKPEIATLFPDSFEESELGNIPKGWHVYPLGDVCEFVYGKAMKASDRIPGPVAVMGSNGQVGWHNVPLVKGPGVVVGRKGNPGIVTWVYRDFYPIDTTFYVAPNTQTVTLTYLFEAIMRLGLPGLSADSAVPGLNRNIAYMSRILVPDPGVLRAFDQQAITLYQRQFQADEQSCTLAGVRDFLLPGKVYMSPETLS